jgi:hypothetical protein
VSGQKITRPQPFAARPGSTKKQKDPGMTCVRNVEWIINDIRTSCGGESWSKSLCWTFDETSQRASVATPFGTYMIAVEPPKNTLKLTFALGSETRTCPTKFTAINRAHWEADDHHQRLQAQHGKNPNRMKPPKW